MRVSRWRSALMVGLATAGVLLGGAGSASAEAANYVALGDSYSSGTGTREYIDDGSDCYRSNHAYPKLYANKIGLALNFQACSGAVTADVINNQLGALSSSTDYVTISIGGNDAGFAPVITQCAKPWPWTCTTEIANAQKFVRETLPGRLDSVYSKIKDKAPNAKVIVVGYPKLFNGEECNFLARISPQEQSDLNATADLIATTTKGRAGAHGFTFVDPRSAFTGHAVCDDVEWLNGLSDPIIESYHPNRAGHVAYTNLIASATKAKRLTPATNG
ncbi:lysophospholipase L1-like esterase [Herbihabitans rhizosphaerae]|uniref:Lysophospholipase L1-like esterase n=1 Tax=Herbihabitans rhizosphaerae TaxID=1872711 RepID=A0A4Q7KZ75_9PSEU|nr:SGNH/GDSL hydrolase family protein [Herbihabitans rhizosphaerae]RZS40992.1 lysophospholipase L1-like esterase [Herbihabitans rhizosphaerae]